MKYPTLPLGIGTLLSNGLFCLLFVSTSFYLHGQKSSFDSSQESLEIEIRGRWDSFIRFWEKEDVKGLASFYTENSKVIPPGYKVNDGIEEISEFYEMLFAANQSSKYEHQIISLTNSDNLIIELGEFEVNWIRNDGSEWTFNARSMTQWELNQKGIWQISLLLFNNPPEVTNKD